MRASTRQRGAFPGPVAPFFGPLALLSPASSHSVLQSLGLLFVLALLMVTGVTSVYGAKENHGMTEAQAVELGERFGIVVGPVDEEIRKELNLQRAEGVVVFEVIGGTPAELSGIKVRAVIKEIDKREVRNMLDFGRALKDMLPTCNYTIGTYEPADPENQGVGGVMNFHFVPCVKD